MKAPCYKCDDRSQACHGTCERYIRFKEMTDGYRDARNSERIKDVVAFNAVDRHIKYEHRHRRK